MVAESPDDGLPPTTEANRARNEELRVKWDSVLDERVNVAKSGIATFEDLISRYEPLFAEASAR